jgi:hypothetical protein
MSNNNLVEISAPLWGAYLEGVKPEMTLMETKVYPMGYGVGLYYPSIEELTILKKASIINVNTIIPLHIKLIYGDIRELTQEFLANVLHLIKDIVFSLRLFRNGWFLDPLFSEITIEKNDNLFRLPGHYRQSFYYNIAIDPEKNYQYQLFLSDLSHESGLQKIFLLLRDYRSNTNTSVGIALENYNNSFGYQLKEIDRLNFLFISLDAIMGGMSTKGKEIGNTKMSKSFLERVNSLVTYGNLQISPQDLNWLDTRCRKIRNDIAHGSVYQIFNLTSEDVVKLQEIVKSLLIEYINLYVYYFKNQKLIKENFNVTKSNSYCGIFNRMLEECIQFEHKKQLLHNISFNMGK